VSTEVVGAKVIKLSPAAAAGVARTHPARPRGRDAWTLRSNRAGAFGRRLRSLAWLAGAAVIVAGLALAVFAPWPITFAAAAAAAVAWCAWLDRCAEL